MSKESAVASVMGSVWPMVRAKVLEWRKETVLASPTARAKESVLQTEKGSASRKEMVSVWRMVKVWELRKALGSELAWAQLGPRPATSSQRLCDQSHQAIADRSTSPAFRPPRPPGSCRAIRLLLSLPT